MAKYVFEELIINSEDPSLENLIGKEVYYGDIPFYCLRSANEDCKVGILQSVHKNEAAPFYVDASMGRMLNCACIIPKKEEPKPEYQPFSNQEEFLNHYAYHKDRLVESSSTHQLSSLGGVWLKDKHLTTFHMVTEIWGDGVIIGDTKMKTVKSGKGEYFTMNDITKWRELLKDYTFLDGTPCGRLVEEKHE